MATVSPENSTSTAGAPGAESKIFWTLYTVVAVTGVFYLAATYLIGAWQWSAAMTVGLLTCVPTAAWLELRGRHIAARSLLIAVANCYVVAMALGLDHATQAGNYCFPALLLGLLLFKPTQKRAITFSLVLPLVTWALIDHQIGLPPARLPHWLSMEVLQAVNFVGSFASFGAILWNFLRHREAEAKALSASLAQAHLSETNLRVVLDAMEEGMLLQDQQSKVLQYNAATLRLFGLSGDELRGLKPTDPDWQVLAEDGSILPYLDYPAAVALRTGVVVRQATIGVRYPNGEIRWFRCQSVPFQFSGDAQAAEERRVISTFADITEVHLAARADRERKELLDQILENMPAAIVLRDIQEQMRIVVWSRYTETLTGIPASRAIGKRNTDLLPPEVAAWGDLTDRQAVARGPSSEGHTTSVKFAHSDAVTHVRARKLPILPDAHGIPRYLLTITDDITTLKNKEDALVAAERAANERGSKMHALFQAMSEGMFSINVDGLVDVCNEAATRILGFTNAEAAGVRIHDLIHHKRPGGTPYLVAESPLYQSMVDGKVYTSDGEHFWTKSGACVPVRLTSTPIRVDGQLQGALLTFVDLTKEKLLSQTIEEQRVQMIAVNKMSSLGEMAGGIAHEINNPLAVIAGRAGQIKRMVALDQINLPKVTSSLVQIEETVERIAKIIRGLRAFSRSAEQDPMEQYNVQQIVSDTLELCRERFNSHGIELRGTVPADVVFECRPAQIAQVLMNLLGNAHDAIESLDEKWVDLSVAVTAKGVAIYVTDSGYGIPQKTADKIMQPFFTTKDVGKGTGLGLSISKGIIDDHQGTLVYDASCVHTRFIITLPLKQQPSLRLEGRAA